MPTGTAHDGRQPEDRRVLLLTPFASPNRGGAETHIDALIAALARRNIWVTLLTHQPLVAPVKAPARERLANGEVIRIPWFGRGWHPRIERFAPLAFAYLVPGLLAGALYHRFAEKTNFDVIHAHGLAAAVAAVGMRWTGARQPIVVSMHAIYDLRQRRQLARRRAFSAAARGQGAGRERGLAAGTSGDRFGPSPGHRLSALDRSQHVFRPRSQAQARAQLGWPTSVPTCLFVGRLLRKKGVGVILELARQLP